MSHLSGLYLYIKRFRSRVLNFKSSRISFHIVGQLYIYVIIAILVLRSTSPYYNFKISVKLSHLKVLYYF